MTLAGIDDRGSQYPPPPSPLAAAPARGIGRKEKIVGVRALSDHLNLRAAPLHSEALCYPIFLSFLSRDRDLPETRGTRRTRQDSTPKSEV